MGRANSAVPDRRADSAVPDRRAITGEFSAGADLISSIVAGLVLGLLADWALGTAPWFVVAGIVAGFATGFFKLWRYSAFMTDAETRARESGTQSFTGGSE